MNTSLSKDGLMVVLSSPSGAGKTTLTRGLVASDQKFVPSVSVTTRKKRQDEIEGKDYYFISENKFQNMLVENKFLEYAEVFGNFYGTPKEQTFELLKSGKDVVYDIDWQGAEQLKYAAGAHVITIFILPPSMAVLKERLLARNTESEESFKMRFNEAKHEIQKCGLYDYIIINHDIEQSLKEIHYIVEAERLSTRRHDVEKLIKSFV